MPNNSSPDNRDLVLAPGEFAYVLDTTKGLVNTNVGPYKTSMAGTDQPVIWDKDRRRFLRCDLEKSIQANPVAPEGYYISLLNPAVDGKTPANLIAPRDGSSSVSVPLSVGHRVNIPGPIHFPLWPGQMASVIQGHHLRSNQYLLAQVYNDTEATANWTSAVLKTPDGAEPVAVTPRSFAPGQLLIIKGTEVAFFIPPTGIKVVSESEKVFVREAVTLERLEYCILLDEDGNKRFVKGPDVVFPEPTEQFIEKDDARKFKAIELNETSGLYVKVIADYTEGDKIYKTGDELFITGKEQAIYFQREEHSVIRYGEQTKHYAVAVPAGEGRYVLNRNTGVVALVEGPRMLLCDPRSEVIVRRVLAEKTVRLWYPNNEKVVEVNLALEALKNKDDASQYLAARPDIGGYAAAMSMTTTNSASKQIAGDVFTRGVSFTPPRTITLDTKYEGAVALSVWTGYAVLIVNKTGQRRVVVGPAPILLQYDETLAPLELSTGTPKTDAKLLNTVYLRVANNKISDLIHVETKDLVNVDLTMSYRMNFEGGNPEHWFAVENYIRLLCDHMRSLIRNTVKRRNIEDFYANAVDIVRDAVLGVIPAGSTVRPGRLFIENYMRVYDVEVLNVVISDKSVAALLLDAQSDALKSAITITKQERALNVLQRLEEINRASAAAKHDTILSCDVLTQAEVESDLSVNLSKIRAEGDAEAAKLARKTEAQLLLNGINVAEIARQQAIDAQKLETAKASIALELQKIVGETEEIVKRAGAVDANLATALITFSDQALVEKISTALAPMAMMSGVSAVDVLSQLFKGTAFEGVMTQLGTRTRMPKPGNGDARIGA